MYNNYKFILQLHIAFVLAGITIAIILVCLYTMTSRSYEVTSSTGITKEVLLVFIKE